MWYLNPKNIAIMILSVFAIGIGIIYLFQRSTVVTLEAQRDALVDANLRQEATIGALNRNLKSIETHQKRVQVIEKQTQVVREIVREIPADIPLGRNEAEDEKIQSAITAAISLFNTGVRPLPPGNSKEILPTPDGTGPVDADEGASENGR